jgi:hypothetical protein
VKVEKRLHRRESGEEKSMLILPLRAYSAFKIGWMSALVSPYPTLTQTYRLKQFFAWNDYLYELAHFPGDILQKNEAHRLALTGQKQVDFHSEQMIIIVSGLLVIDVLSFSVLGYSLQ